MTKHAFTTKLDSELLWIVQDETKMHECYTSIFTIVTTKIAENSAMSII